MDAESVYKKSVKWLKNTKSQDKHTNNYAGVIWKRNESEPAAVVYGEDIQTVRMALARCLLNIPDGSPVLVKIRTI